MDMCLLVGRRGAKPRRWDWCRASSGRGSPSLWSLSTLGMEGPVGAKNVFDLLRVVVQLALNLASPDDCTLRTGGGHGAEPWHGPRSGRTAA